MSKKEKMKKRASRYLIGGLSSGWNDHPISGPIYFKKSEKAYLYDVEGNKYIDYLAGHGSLFLGHNPKVMSDAIIEAFNEGFICQYETEHHIELAEILCSSIPCAEKVRLSNTGTEATMNAIRLARYITGKNKILKFEGHFHGLHDYVQYATDTSPVLGEIQPNGEIEPVQGSVGIPDILDELVIIISFNDIDAFGNVVEKYKDDLAAIIMEPIAFNMGCVMPERDFLSAVREITEKEGIILIFDEVITGFRMCIGGAQEHFGITPDLACYGKAFGCGMPISALVGKNDIMKGLTPTGDMQMAGTNTGRLFSVIGTLASLKELTKDGFYDAISNLNDAFCEGFNSLLNKYEIPAHVEGVGGCVGIYFGLTERPRNFRDICNNWNGEYHKKFFKKALFEKYLYGFAMPSLLYPERIVITAAHSMKDIDDTMNRVEDIFKELDYK